MNEWMASAFLITAIIVGCVAMTRGTQPAVALAVVALIGLALAGGHAESILGIGFKHFADVAFAFTAVGVPAHRIAKGGGFARVALWCAYQLGLMTLARFTARRNAIIVACLVATWAVAALAHNSTSIWVMAGLTIGICAAFRIRPRWILCGELVASNLGGFSSTWGDTPNMIESAVWGLTAEDFAREILPANLIVLAMLIATVIVLTGRDRSVASDPIRSAADVAGIGVDASTQPLDRGQVAVNAVILVVYLVGHVVFPAERVALAAAAIGLSVLLAPGAERVQALEALGFDVYLTFAAVFILAGCVAHSLLGTWLATMISRTGAGTWVVLLASYFGTMLTEAASWTAAVAELVHKADPGHRSAWALGAGICAGSSSLLTAASAGIILARETRRFGGEHDHVGFGEYLLFGLGFSAAMLVIYAGWITVMFGEVP